LWVFKHELDEAIPKPMLSKTVDSSLPRSTWMIIKTLGRMFYGQLIQNDHFLDVMGPIVPGENKTLQSTVRTSYQRSSRVVVV
jgi:hypothetical protein